MNVDYENFKSLVLSGDFPWHWQRAYNDWEVTEDTQNFDFFSHVLLQRPGHTKLHSVENSHYLPIAEKIFSQFCDVHKVNAKVLYRANVNMTLPSDDPRPSPMHTDHDFPHRNLILYLTDCEGGATVVEGQEPFYGKENEFYIFEGRHQHYLPKTGRRVVLVYTFL
jgi:hypothetical protein